MLQTQASEADIREIIKPGYDIEAVDVEECTESEYQQGFEENAPILQIDLESSVEEIEAKAERTQEQIMAEAKSSELCEECVYSIVNTIKNKGYEVKEG